MALVPGGKVTISKDEFLRQFGSSDGPTLGLDLLRDAVNRHDPIDVEMALIVCFKFGFTDDHVEPLIQLAYADWHRRHEDVASALGEIRSPLSVDALAHLAKWVPNYLDYDNARALAVKAIWALGRTGNADARRELELLSHAESEIVAKNARTQLERLG